MSILQDVRFVNESCAGNDCYMTSYWILLPAWGLAVNVFKTDGWASQDWDSNVYSKAENDMPEEVQNWFLSNSI